MKNATYSTQRPRFTVFRMGLLLVLLAVLAWPAYAQETSIPVGSILDCDANGDGTLDGDPLNDENPDWTDIVGDHTGGNTYWSAAAFHDNHNQGYQYFAFRLHENPFNRGGKGEYTQHAWVALMQVPGANQFQYQWLLNLSGIAEQVQIWENTTPENVDFDPIFNDPAEGTNLPNTNPCDQGGSTDPNWCTSWTSGGPTGASPAGDTYNMNGKLARVETAASTIGGNADYLLFFAIPIAQLITLGVITDHTDLDETLYFLATSANENNYNKDYLDCSFGPRAVLDIDKTVSPTIIFDVGPHDLTYTIVVTADATSVTSAQGVVIEDDDFSSCIQFAYPTDVSITAPAGSTVNVVSAKNPADPGDLQLEVRVSKLEPGESVTIEIDADASSCTFNNASHINWAEAFATNANMVMDPAEVSTALPVELVAFDAVLDGRDLTLRWQTASETNNAGFEVQQRYTSDAGAWETLGWVDGHGTTLEGQAYRFSVDGLAPGHHTFRLKQIDYDGTFDYSPEIEVAVEMPEAFLVTEIYPNPFNPQATFSFGVRQQQQVIIEVFDMLGRRVMELYRGAPEGGVTQTMFVDGSTLGSGTYVVRVLGEHFVDTQTFTVVK